jgi:hypothetical protein
MAGMWFAKLEVIGNTSIQTKRGKVTVAGHPSTDLPPKTLKSILRQAGLEN